MAERTHVGQARMYAAGRLFVDAYLWSDGAVSIEGQDLGPHTPGGGEYEYIATVEAGDVPLLLTALGTPFVEEVLSALSAQGEAILRHGESRWLRDHGVPFSMQTW